MPDQPCPVPSRPDLSSPARRMDKPEAEVEAAKIVEVPTLFVADGMAYISGLSRTQKGLRHLVNGPTWEDALETLQKDASTDKQSPAGGFGQGPFG